MRNSLLLLFCLPLAAFAQSTIIKDVNLLDVETRTLRPSTAVVITGNRVTAIDDFANLATSAEDRIIEAAGKFLIPGLIDAHIHFFQSGGLYTRPDAVDLRRVRPYTEEIQFAKDNAADYLQRYLRLGITTVMDVGGPMWNFTVRDSIATGMLSPDVLVTGPLFSIVARPQMDEGDPPIVKVTNREEIDALFEQMLPYQPDFMKIWYIASRQYPPQETYPLVEYIGQLCDEHNLRLAVHATQLETAQLAVKAGADILVHSVDNATIPEDFARELAEKQVTYIPTLTVSNGYFRAFTGQLNHTDQDLAYANPHAYNTLMDLERIPEAQWPNRLKAIYNSGMPPNSGTTDSLMAHNLRLLAKLNANIATGTDAGNIGTMHASSYMPELLAMQAAGLSNWDLLVYSTLNPAKGFGKGDQLGSIKTGKQADMVLLSQNPLLDINHLEDIELVIKAGQALPVDSMLQETPEQIVQRQVNAYNARDIDAFLDTYARDVVVYNQQGELSMKGHEQMRATYEPMFKEVTNLYCDIQNRIVINNKVIDREHVRFGDRYSDVVAIYDVADGKIVKVRFIR